MILLNQVPIRWALRETTLKQNLPVIHMDVQQNNDYDKAAGVINELEEGCHLYSQGSP